jgi:hypothetical protein
MIAMLLSAVFLGWAAGRASGDLVVGILTGLGVLAALYLLTDGDW